MARSASARRRAAALALACLAAAALVLGPGAGPAAATRAQIDCVVNPNAPECQEQPTTTLAPTTTEPEPVDPSPTTTEPATTTTTAPSAVAPTATTSPPATRSVPTTAAPVETTTTESATTLTTRSNLLIAGDGTQGAESTTTTLRTETRVQGGSGPSDGTLIALIIGGLVVVAGLVGALTFRYWRATAPTAAAGQDGEASVGEARVGEAGAAPGSEVTTPRSSPAGARGAPAP
jgi:hypothetical protein